MADGDINSTLAMSGMQQSSLWMQALQSRCDDFVKNFDSIMDWIVHEGLPNACSALADKAGKAMSGGVNYVAEKTASPSLKPSDTPTGARSQDTPGQQPAQGLSASVQQQVDFALPNRGAFECQSVDMSCQVSPYVTPVNQSLGMSYGGPAMSMA